MRFHIVFFSAVTAALLVNGLWLNHYWYEDGPEYRPVYGANFSCRHADWLGLDCRETLDAVLDDLGVRHLRLSVYWDDVEPEDDRFDFSSIDWQIEEARKRDARVLLTVGIKAQRYPEFYFPDWLARRAEIPTEGDYSPMWIDEIRAEAMEMLEAVVRHYADEPVIEAWQVENEPLLKNRSKTHGWWIPPDILAEEVALVRRTDPRNRPAVITHSSWTSLDDDWRTALDLGDVLGQSVYTRQHHSGPSWFYVRRFQMGPLTPNLPAQADAARRQGKEYWITELQAEPDEAQETLTLQNPNEIGSISPGIMRDNVSLANHTGAARVYLWGVEWWLYMKERRGVEEYWDAGRAIYRSEVTLAGSPPPAAAASSGS